MNYLTANNTAILLFARSVKEEIHYKRLGRNTAENQFLLESLKRNALEVAEKTSLPLFHYNETDQRGKTFGERIANSISSIFEKGYRKVIVMGSDCPDIAVKDIRIAEKILSENKMAIGPDQRGGTFLLGLTTEMFDSGRLANLNWQTTELLDSIELYASALQHEVTYLDQKFDLNEEKDLVEYAGKSHFLSEILTQIFNISAYQGILCLLNIYHSFSRNHFRRGPPATRTTY